jgi:DNA mismatch repair protein MutL
MPIRVLAPHEAAKIAAGEVIERPASVVKELVENSLDAGAQRVTVELREGGLALIRVVDDGCGIDPAELRLAFERHATSKVASEDDLWRVATLGFRGEALPSIAAAGEVEVLTRVAGNDVGARIRFRDGALAEQGAGACPPGTTFTVRRLFAAQPARLKFLRTPAAEATQVATVVAHYALAYPEVRFELVADGRASLTTPGSGSLVDALAAVYGPEAAAYAVAVEAPAPAGEPSVRGLAVDPAVHRASRNYISLFVNRRWVRNRALTFAVEEAYTGMLPAGRHPVAVLEISVPPDEVDVNVHPTKAEVRLRREREVFAAVQRAVRRALAAAAPVPSASASLWPSAAVPAANAPSPAEFDRPPLWLTQRPWQARFAAPAPLAPEPTVDGATGGPATTAAVATAPPLVERLPLLRAVGQLASTYVVAEAPDGMYLVDQHAAHERVLYERMLAAVRAGRPEAQPLLEPLAIELDAPAAALLAEQAAAFARLGFDVAHFGDRAWMVRAVPAVLAGDDIAANLRELLDRAAREAAADGAARDEPSHRLAASLACHAAVRAGMTLAEAEQRELLRSLESCEAPRTCPHGRPTTVHLAAEAIAREFRRR